MTLHFQFTPESLRQYNAEALQISRAGEDHTPNDVYLFRLIPLNTVVVGVVAQHMGIGLLAGILFAAAHFFTREWFDLRARKKALSPEVLPFTTKPWQLELKAESISLENEDVWQESGCFELLPFR